jgi:HEAT repeat protein
MVPRGSVLFIGGVWLFLGAGCAHTWDALTSQRFREAPFTTLRQLIQPEDPVVVLLADPPRSGDERAAAWQRLSAERFHQCAPEQQLQLWHMIERDATREASPWVRLAAIQALGRIPDPRTVGLLIAAYQQADGYPDGSIPAAAISSREQEAATGTSAGRRPTRVGSESLLLLSGPRGFPPEWSNAIRARTLEALGHTQSVEAVRFLATVAGAYSDNSVPGSEERDVRLAAIRALSRCRQPEAVDALFRVLQQNPHSTDTALIHRTHEGLVRLTGRDLPPDPHAWQEVLQAGVTLAPEPTWWEEATEKVVQAVRWFR